MAFSTLVHVNPSPFLSPLPHRFPIPKFPLFYPSLTQTQRATRGRRMPLVYKPPNALPIPGDSKYIITTLKVVPRGTEGAVSLEGTLAGLLASIFLASIGYFMGQINTAEAVICVIAFQIANCGESLIGASLQEKEGFRWLNNDAVNVISLSMGSILAVLMQQALLKNLHR